MAFQRSTLWLILGIAIFVPSAAHAHGFPWWFGAIVVLPFQLVAVLVALPCKAGILRLAIINKNQLVPWKGLLKIMLVDLVVLFLSVWAFETVTRPVQNFLRDFIDYAVSRPNRVAFDYTCDKVVAFFVGAALTLVCAAILWLPHFVILRKAIVVQAEVASPAGNGQLLLWSFLIGSAGPAIFWLPACLRLL